MSAQMQWERETRLVKTCTRQPKVLSLQPYGSWPNLHLHMQRKQHKRPYRLITSLIDLAHIGTPEANADGSQVEPRLQRLMWE